MDSSFFFILILTTFTRAHTIKNVKIHIDKFSTRNSYVQYDTNYRSLIASQTNAEQEILAKTANNFLTFCQLSQLNNENKCFHSVETLDFTNNNLRTFPSSLTNTWFDSLLSLNLSKNQINNFNDDFHLFKSGLTLTSLDLSSNKLNRIASDTFKQLKSLKSLRLNDNQIAYIDSFAFTDSLSGLTELDLSHNYITDASMEFLIFASLSKLRTLKLGYNQLSTFSDQMILNLYSLETLDLSNNNLKTFDLWSLGKSNTLLTSLDLSFNRILKFETNMVTQAQFLSYQTDLNPQERSSNRIETLNLSGIDFSGSQINQFLSKLFSSHQKLRHVNISHAKINKYIYAYYWPNNIQTLDLSFNSLTEFECPNTLEKIYLKNNQLSNFTALIESCVKPMSQISLDLRNNLFTGIDNINSDLDQEITEDVTLLISGNPLMCECESSWWSMITSINNPSIFTYKKNIRASLHIVDYKELSCQSLSLNQRSTLTKTTRFSPIRAKEIASRLACPYQYSCAADKCKCCGFRECDCAFNCPAKCACVRDFKNSFDIVNCTGNDLETVPRYLPISTTSLQLSHNSLKRIQPYEFFGRFNLDMIDLSFNEINFIEENTFNSLGRLKTLKMSENRLQILLGNEFKELVGLEVLMLDKNRLQFISNITFVWLVKLRYLNLMDNKLRHIVDRGYFFQKNLLLRDLFVDQPITSTKIDSNESVLKKKKTNWDNQIWIQRNRLNAYKTNKFKEITMSPYVVSNSLKRIDSDRDSVIVFNYSTILWSSLAFIFTLLIFSILCSVLVAKLIRNKKKQTRLIDSPVRLIRHEKALYATTNNFVPSGRRLKKKTYFKSKFWKSLKQKFRCFVGKFNAQKMHIQETDPRKQLKLQEVIALHPNKCQSNVYSLYF